MAAGALVVIGLRAALRLELRWDTFMYHIPFAAKRAGIAVSYELLPNMQSCYEGFPPLPEFLQGVLWRLTGSINATGVVNYLALGLFLYFCHRCLKVWLWLTVILAFTTPLVLIHAATSYIDLLSGAFLGIAVSAFAVMLLFDRWLEKELLLWGLAGMACSAWSKYSTLPIVAALGVWYLIRYGRRLADPKSRQLLRYVLVALVIAALPYVKNSFFYGNPLWPARIPVFSERFPYIFDGRVVREQQSPPPLQHASQPELFFRSLFEIGHPTNYAHRERWIIDQGNATIAFRSGGFWVVGMLTAVFAAIVFGFISARRRGLLMVAFIAGLWCFVSWLPQSHELRYYQFIPLTMAALVSMLIPLARARCPMITLAALCIILVEFVYITKINRSYYRVERIGYMEAAEAFGLTRFWKTLETGKTYCAVGFEPAGFLLTGPTMGEFRIIDRPDVAGCPPDVAVMQKSNN